MTQRDRLSKAACAMLSCALALTCMGSARAKGAGADPKNGAARVQEIRTALGLK
jgi:hypothetical protein